MKIKTKVIAGPATRGC